MKNEIVEIKLIDKSQLEECIHVIRQSFATVAKNFNLTIENCPTYTGFMQIDKLFHHYECGHYMYGYFLNGKIVGYVSLSKENDTIYELRNLAILPEHRHKGYGTALINFCRNKVKDLGGNKIAIGIIDENKILKKWYTENGFQYLNAKKIQHLPFTAGYMELIL